MEKYKQYIELSWWTVNKRTVELWMKNFGERQDLAHLILDNIIFYNKKQLKSYTRQLINRLKENIYVDASFANNYVFVNDSVLENYWIDYLSKARFMPAALPGDVGSSAYQVISYWRSELECDERVITDISTIEEQYQNGIRKFILVDDFSGSGQQMLKVLKQKVTFAGKVVELGNLHKIKSDVEIVIAVYVIHRRAKKILTRLYPGIKVLYIDILNADFDYLNSKSPIYDCFGYKQKDKNEAVKVIKMIQEDLITKDLNLRALINYDLHIPIVFEHGCPNNTLSLLFAHTEQWNQLFRRGNEV